MMTKTTARIRTNLSINSDHCWIRRGLFEPWPTSSSKSSFSSWASKGEDLLAASFDATLGGRPKVLLESMAPSGFDVANLLKKVDESDDTLSGTIHLQGSILVFPQTAFLWKIEHPRDITVQSLAPVMLHRPIINHLFIGSAIPLEREQLKHIQKEMRDISGISVDWLPLSDAMATFNILNAEDRPVATALIVDTDESNYIPDGS